MKDLFNAKSAILEVPKVEDFECLYDWFDSAVAFKTWAGPTLVRPAARSQLKAAIDISPYLSLALKHDSHLFAFGQLQLVGSRAHLARLAVNPLHRRQGLSIVLINKLIASAAKRIQLKSISLFVYKHNQPAIGSYTKLGFVNTAFPKSIKPIKDCMYMTMHY